MRGSSTIYSSTSRHVGPSGKVSKARCNQLSARAPPSSTRIYIVVLPGCGQNSRSEKRSYSEIKLKFIGVNLSWNARGQMWCFEAIIHTSNLWKDNV